MDEDYLFQVGRRTRCVDGQILMIANIMIRSAATNNSANILPFWRKEDEEFSSCFIVAVALFFSVYPISLILETGYNDEQVLEGDVRYTHHDGDMGFSARFTELHELAWWIKTNISEW